MPLHTFTKDTNRLRVINEDSPLVGKTGTFVRRLTRSSEGWVRMDDELPPEVQSTYADAERRLHWAVLFPDECEQVQQ